MLLHLNNYFLNSHSYNADTDHDQGNCCLTLYLVFQLRQTEHSIEYPESTVVEVTEGDCADTACLCHQNRIQSKLADKRSCQGSCGCDRYGCRSECQTHQSTDDNRDQDCRDRHCRTVDSERNLEIKSEINKK